MSDKKLSKKELRNIIKTDLINQLVKNNNLGKFYEDMVEDYIYFWDLKAKLQRDIKSTGLRYKVTNGNGKDTEKDNISVANLLKVNTQMLKILTDLNLKEPSIPPPTPEGGKKIKDDLLSRD